MLNLSVYPKNEEPIVLDISENYYEKLAHTGIGNIGQYKSYKMSVDGESYEIDAVKLDFETRRKLLDILEEERHKELVNIFNKSSKISDKELDYVRLLTSLYEMIRSEQNIYFSCE